ILISEGLAVPSSAAPPVVLRRRSRGASSFVNQRERALAIASRTVRPNQRRVHGNRREAADGSLQYGSGFKGRSDRLASRSLLTRGLRKCPTSPTARNRSGALAGAMWQNRACLPLP